MNSKMAINTYLSNKKNSDRIMGTDSILMVAKWKGGLGEWVKR